MRDYGLPAYDAGVLVAEQATADFYETVAKGRDAKLAANWVIGDLFAALNRTGRDDRGQPGVRRRARRAARPDGGQHDQRPHRQGRVRGDGGDRRGRRDASSRRRACGRSPTPARSTPRWTQVLAANADKVAEYRAGKDKLFGFFVGQVMKAMAGKGNPGAGQRGAEAGISVTLTPALSRKREREKQGSIRVLSLSRSAGEGGAQRRVRGHPSAPTSCVTAVLISRTSANSRAIGAKISACSRA